MSNTSPAPGTPPVPVRLLPATTAASDPLPVRTGHCQCGRISYQVTGIPDDPHLCSCSHCVRISGSPGILWVGFPRSTLTWTDPEGRPAWYATWPTLHRGFCPTCGTTLVSAAEGSPVIMVTAFSLADRSGTEPVGHSFREQAAPWMAVTLADQPAPPPAAL